MVELNITRTITSHRHSRRTIAATAAALAIVAGGALPATAAAGDSEDPSAAWAYDVPSTPRKIAPTAEEQAKMAVALESYLSIPTLTIAEKARGQAQFNALPSAARNAIAKTKKALGSASTFAAGEGSYKTLGIVQVNQEKGYWCGPASAYMILKGDGRTKSADTGKALSQTNLASSSYLGTTADTGTPWAGKRMETGIDKWRGVNFYVQATAPTAELMMGALRSTVGNYELGVGADTVEFAGGTHYNNHPANKQIGHWIVAYGYTDDAGVVKFRDPSPSYYPDAAPSFSTSTRYFTETFLQSNGIMW